MITTHVPSLASMILRLSMVLRFWLSLLALAAAGAILRAKPTIVVTTTLIATAVQDVAGDSFEIETLMPAGTCPGQFDLDPRQAGQVSRSALIIRHDMQGFLDRLFLAAGARRELIIAPKGTFTVPSTYLAYCEKIADELRLRMPELSPLITAHLEALKTRSAALSEELKSSSSEFSGVHVLSAMFQADFLTWLGMKVVATFPPTEDPSPSLLQKAVAAGQDQHAVLLVGNLQNGTRLPTALADALGIPCVILSNFPEQSGPGAQESLMRHNLGLLLKWKNSADAKHSQESN